MAKAEYRNAIRSRQLINAALAELLHENPLDKITVSDVVRKANINRSTFYAHYQSIPDVINSLIDQTFDRIRDVFQKKHPAEQTPSIILKEIQALLEQDLDFYQVIMTSSAASMVQERIAGIVLEYLSHYGETILSDKRNEMDILLIFCAGGLIRLYQSWFTGKLTISLDELTEIATKMILSTIESI